LERAEVFSDCPINRSEREALLAGFLSVCEWVEVFFLWRPNLPDEGDNHVLELAVAGGAQVVVTQNVRDFRGELRFPRIKVLTPAQYLKLKR
jgi:predicted nucleic acid-binding protein